MPSPQIAKRLAQAALLMAVEGSFIITALRARMLKNSDNTPRGAQQKMATSMEKRVMSTGGYCSCFGGLMLTPAG